MFRIPGNMLRDSHGHMFEKHPSSDLGMCRYDISSFPSQFRFKYTDLKGAMRESRAPAW